MSKKYRKWRIDKPYLAKDTDDRYKGFLKDIDPNRLIVLSGGLQRTRQTRVWFSSPPSLARSFVAGMAVNRGKR